MRRQRPDQVAYWDSSRSVTYADLAGRTASIAAEPDEGGVCERRQDRDLSAERRRLDRSMLRRAARRRGRRSHQLRRGGRRDQLSPDGRRLRDRRHDGRQEGPGRQDLRVTPRSRRVDLCGPDAENRVCVGRPRGGTGAVPLDPDDIDRSSFIIYTSGTTGRAKGVLLSLRGMLWIAASCWAPIAADREGCRAFAVASLPFLRLEPVGARRARRRRERAHHGEVLAAAGARSAADREVFGPARRADDVPLSSAPRSGDRRRAARRGPPLHLRRRDHAGDL